MITRKNLWFVMVSLLLFSSCGPIRTTKNTLLAIEKGMSKPQVLRLMGEPRHRRFDDRGEEWEYTHAHLFETNNTIVIINFSDGKVVGLDSFEDLPEANNRPVVVYPSTPNRNRFVNRDVRNLQVMDKSSFDQLYDRIRKEPFEKDKIKILEVGAINSLFTCKQCVRILSTTGFEDERKEMLRILIGRIVDGNNYEEVIEMFPLADKNELREEFLRVHR